MTLCAARAPVLGGHEVGSLRTGDLHSDHSVRLVSVRLLQWKVLSFSLVNDK